MPQLACSAREAVDELNFRPDGVRLRALEPSDADALYEIENDPAAEESSDYMAPLSLALLREYASGYDANPFGAGQLRLIVECGGEAAGVADLYDISLRDLTACVGIYLLPRFRGRGLGTAALRRLERQAFTRLGLQALCARVSEDNDASLRLFDSAGWRRCGVLPHWRRSGVSRRTDVALYVRLP